MPSLYVLETGARLEIEHQRLLVTKDDEVLLRLPVHTITQIILMGRIGLTTPAVHELLELNIPVIFLSSAGVYLGQLSTPASYNLPLRLQQYRRNDQPEFALGLARSIVAGKIHNQCVQASRWARRNTEISPEKLARLAQYESEAAAAPDLPYLLGIEGSAARLYFELFQKVVDPAWNFTDRNRRPPKDPINAMLSLGYTLLTYTLSAALQIVGLDPYLGYYHAEAYGRPSLALDLVEEFRAPVVDSLVASLVNHRQITQDDFVKSGEVGIYLSPRAKRVFSHQFARKLESQVTLFTAGRPLTYQKIFEWQARKLVHLIQGEEPVYPSFRAR